MEDIDRTTEPKRLLVDTPLTHEEQVNLATKLQTLLLRTYEIRLEAGSLSDTGLSSLQRLLAANGWSLDPARLPKGLADLLTSQVDPKELDDEGVFPIRRNG